jgi:hypothetical protein
MLQTDSKSLAAYPASPTSHEALRICAAQVCRRSEGASARRRCGEDGGAHGRAIPGRSRGTQAGLNRSGTSGAAARACQALARRGLGTIPALGRSPSDRRSKRKVVSFAGSLAPSPTTAGPKKACPRARAPHSNPSAHLSRSEAMAFRPTRRVR